MLFCKLTAQHSLLSLSLRKLRLMEVEIKINDAPGTGGVREVHEVKGKVKGGR